MRHREDPRRRLLPGLWLAWVLFAAPTFTRALDAPLQISQHSHTSWTARDGYASGMVFAIAQTHDGFLWLGGEYGLLRFDGRVFTPWQAPAGTRLPSSPYSLLVSRDGTLWIGTFEGLVSWNGIELTDYPEIDKGFVTSLLEDRDGTIWVGTLAREGQLCAIRNGKAQCDRHAGAFGGFVWSLAEDADGALWVGAESGLWRWRPGPPRRYELPGQRLADLITSRDGRLLFGIRGAGLMRFVADQPVPYPLRSANVPHRPLPDQDIKTNKLLRDRDGGIWIGTDGRGLVHVQDGQADTFSKADGLSGNIACSLFEDREGNIWFASERGLDRFRKLPVVTISESQGLSSDATKSVLASRDGSLWIATNDGVTRWRDSSPTVFGKASGLPDLAAQSLFEDFSGRLWVSTARGPAYLDGNRFVPVGGLPSKEVFSMSGDREGRLWMSGNQGLARFQAGRFVENIPWARLGRRQQAKVVVADQGGVWLSFWLDGGVMFFKDGEVQASYSTADGLGKGHVSGLRIDDAGAVWAATAEGGLSRIANGRISSLTTANGLPCDSIHWSLVDRQGSLWMYTACGLVRVTGDQLQRWLTDPATRVIAKTWGATDGVTLRAVSPAYFNPPVALADDGRIWFVSGGGVQVVDPDHLPMNTVTPPVYIEAVVADRKPYAIEQDLRLPPLVRDVTIEFNALSLANPNNVRFRYRLEGHDEEWLEVLDRRQVTYTNLGPGAYRFQVKAANDSGIWNETGATLRFYIAPSWYQATWFRVGAVLLALGLVWGGIQLRVRRLRREQKRLRQVIEGIPAMAFSVHPDGSPDLVNQRWLEFSGLSPTASAESWQSALHPADLETHLRKWRHALTTGEAFENEARHRSASGEYRWFLVQAAPLRDRHGRILKWYGALTDIEERKRAEAERERLQRLEAHLAHTNRMSMLGELTASLAHEVNQPIGAVIASAGASLRWLDRETPDLPHARDAIARIKNDAKRAADIIAGLKAFYRKDGLPKRALLDVNAVVAEMLVLLHREAERHRVIMRTDLAPDLPAVKADRVQLQQVLMNLMVNGIEAMGDKGGQLDVKTRAEGQEVVVSVSDAGPGIPEDMKEQIFSAFVTSKPAGTGMGLAISRTIVESHEGKLWVESHPPAGATFHFTLPAAPAGEARDPA